MNTTASFRNSAWNNFNWLLATLALALAPPTRAATPPGAIPFSDIGARATANYQGDVLGVTATADGACLRCGFQKLEGQATPEGLWLKSAKPGAAGRLRLVALAVGPGGSGARPCAPTETASSVRSGMSIVTVPQHDQAPLGAPCTHGAASCFHMPLLTELETTCSDVPFYRRAAPNGAIVCPRQGAQTLARTGKVSVADKLVRFTRPGLTEEYSVSVDGVRQDFIIESPPLNPQPSTRNHSAGDLRVELALTGARAEATASGARIRLDSSGRVLAYSRLRAEDATGRELTARLEVLSADRLAVTVTDANATYPVRIDPTFSDADWVSLNPGLPGADGQVLAMAVDANGNVYVCGGFGVIGTVPANCIAKWDGSAWSALDAGMNSYVYALAVSGTNLYAAGVFSTAGGVPANNIAKWDGRAWSALGSGIGGAVNALAVSGTNLYAGGQFTTAGGVTVYNIAKWDGSAWSALGSGLWGGSDSCVYALVVSGTDLYAGGQFTTAGAVTVYNIAKWNGRAWSALGSGIVGYVNASADIYSSVFALAASGTYLYAGGCFTNAGGVSANNIAKWDGSTWSAVGSDIVGYSGAGVAALTVSGTDLYAGGAFTTAGGVTANSIAKWNGTAWSALGSGIGMNGGVRALAVSGTNLYSGGQFSTAGGVPANNIAKWNGSAWSALGSGINSDVLALTVSGTNLYAGGAFATAGGATVNYIAKWNGSAWSALGSGMNNAVRALAVSGTNLYAGGDFSTAGGVPANCIAEWNGHAWSALGSGMNGGVFALAVSGTDLYAGGDFSTAGGVSANCIAKWNGHAWSALGSGMGGSYTCVNALTVSGNNLCAGGYFANAGGVPANNIAKWNGHAWSALGSGVSGYVNALAVSATDLYAGGRFSAGGVTEINVGKWNGSAWSALGSGMSQLAQTLAVSGTDLYAGGCFYSAGEVLVYFIAKWDGSAWSALGSGLSGGPSGPFVNALAADGAGHLFVGGGFTFAGTNVSPFIAQANLGSVPAILTAPATQTAEAGATVDFAVDAAGGYLTYELFFNGTNLLSCGNDNSLELTNVNFSQSGTYTVVVTNVFGAATSAPVTLNVIPAVERRPVPGVKLMGQPGTSWDVVYADALSLASVWTRLDSVSLNSTPQYYFDLTQPLPPQRFYRAWQAVDPVVLPVLDLRMVPAITVTGSIGNSVRVDAINRFGPIDAWVTLDTVTLTNTSQLYFDVSAPGQPERLYRIVPSP